MNGGSIVAVAKFHRNGCYKDDLTGEFLAATFPNPPCADYRTSTEEIVLSSSVTDAAGNPVTSVNLSTTAAQQYTFTFSQAIPINATDLFIQIVFKGKLGDEEGAVVVATKDVFEPTYLAVLNSTDRILFNGTFYATTDPALLPTLAGSDNQLSVSYKPSKLNAYLGFKNTFVGSPLGSIIDLPPARYSRIAMLTVRNPFTAPIQVFSTQTGSAVYSAAIYELSPETNQFDTAADTYFVSAFGKARGVPGWNALLYYLTYGFPDIGDLSKLPVLSNTAPFPVTCLSFKPGSPPC